MSEDGLEPHYDAGALIALERGERQMWSDYLRTLQRGGRPRTSAPVLAQVWRSPRQAVLSRALRDVDVVATDEKLARRAGELCAATQTSDVVDALVVATAEVRGGVVITSDPSDIAALATHARGPVRVIAI